MSSCFSLRWPFSVSRIALVESRSCTNSGSVGTSNDKRSALPDQFKKGLESAFNLLRESCAAMSLASMSAMLGFAWPVAAMAGVMVAFLPFATATAWGAGSSKALSPLICASSAAMSASPFSRAGFWLSQSSAGEMDESY